MRLSEHELLTIRQKLNTVDPHGKIYLFGSRTEDARKGGDIEIYFETTAPLDLKTKLLLEYQLN